MHSVAGIPKTDRRSLDKMDSRIRVNAKRGISRNEGRMINSNTKYLRTKL